MATASWRIGSPHGRTASSAAPAQPKVAVVVQVLQHTSLVLSIAWGIVPLSWLASVGVAQAPKLDDPQHSVFHAFPAADAYRVIVRDIDAAARKRIEKRLPFRVHFDELGPHSLYVALRNRRPIGMLYVHYEESDLGLTIVEWAITVDQRVAGFKFQRTRNKLRRRLERSEFVRLLSGKSCTDLKEFLDEDGQLLPGVRGLAAGTESLAAAVVRSGVKTFAVLESVWQADVAKLKDLNVGMRTFPEARRFHRLWPKPVSAKQVNKKQLPAPIGEPAIDRSLRWAIRAYGIEGRSVGIAAELSLDAEQPTALSFIAVDARGMVIAVGPAADLSPALRAQCSAARGRKLAELTTGDGPVPAALTRLRNLIEGDTGSGR